MCIDYFKTAQSLLLVVLLLLRAETDCAPLTESGRVPLVEIDVCPWKACRSQDASQLPEIV
jgi:hypothetical protein